jgi:hypothetical protein
MTITLIIIAYILNVFLNRWLDKLLVRKLGSCPIPFLWFFSIINTGALLFMLLEKGKFYSWFVGKHW